MEGNLRRMQRMLTFFGLAGCVYLMLVTGLYVAQRQLLYLPDRSIPSRTASGVPEMSEVRLHTDDGLDLLAWHRPAAPRRATILYLHGNGGHIGYRGDRVRPFIDAGFEVLLVEYRGYGGNPGRPSEQGLMSDARAALAFLDALARRRRQPSSTANPSAAPWPWRSRRSGPLPASQSRHWY